VSCDSIGLQVTTEITMAWTETTRPQHGRVRLRHASDPTDAERAMIVLFMPERRHFAKLRAVIEAKLYIAGVASEKSSGCA
jgi:hypothetical protein